MEGLINIVVVILTSGLVMLFAIMTKDIKKRYQAAIFLTIFFAASTLQNEISVPWMFAALYLGIMAYSFAIDSCEIIKRVSVKAWALIKTFKKNRGQESGRTA